MLIIQSILVFALAACAGNASAKHPPAYDRDSNIEWGRYYDPYPQPKQQSTIRKEWYDIRVYF